MPIRSSVDHSAPVAQKGGATGRVGAKTPVPGAPNGAKAAGAPAKREAQSKAAASQARRMSDVITNAPKVPAHICMGTVRESAKKMGF
eukprot:CAMPEP_0194549808 /NCGR_PEP_ID=MMETSP0253-20130528/95394_1 /TAXON_ID=2966 /ORGANISM="Noctiluca scintillans" /LENGTH=87 /DNA_ID=CAMNT_0039397241 /DNA_START=1 /DNA_END=264 /DNA_ORIENTATION=+